jgi:hypothetical protein
MFVDPSSLLLGVSVALLVYYIVGRMRASSAKAASLAPLPSDAIPPPEPPSLPLLGGVPFLAHLPLFIPLLLGRRTYTDINISLHDQLG